MICAVEDTSFHDVIWVCNIVFSHILSGLSLTVLSGYILLFCQDILYRSVRIYSINVAGPVFCLTYVFAFCITEKNRYNNFEITGNLKLIVCFSLGQNHRWTGDYQYENMYPLQGQSDELNGLSWSIWDEFDLWHTSKSYSVWISN